MGSSFLGLQEGQFDYAIIIKLQFLIKLNFTIPPKTLHLKWVNYNLEGRNNRLPFSKTIGKLLLYSSNHVRMDRVLYPP